VDVKTLADLGVRTLARILPPRLMRASRFFGIWEARGYHVTPVHFYEPVPDTRELAKRDFDARSRLLGVPVDLDAAVARLHRYSQAYGREYSELPRDAPAEADDFFVRNPFFATVDAEILYCFIRELRPRLVIEAGSGFSTRIILRALARNTAEGDQCRYEIFDPFPSDTTRATVGRRAALTESLIQAVDPGIFQRLEPNDVLFIDSSHVVATGSDVTYLVLEVLPSLRSGVYVHFHDIFLPHEYPRSWVLELHRFWNEQYVLQAFLAFNDEFEIVWPGYYVHAARPDELRRAIHSYVADTDRPTSFWLRRK
jgi:hypothetical protein